MDTTTPDFKGMSLEIGRQAAKYPELGHYLPAAKHDDFRQGLAVAVAVAVHPYLELIWETTGKPSSPRLCACGCGQPVPGHRADAKYATGACRVRAHRRVIMDP